MDSQIFSIDFITFHRLTFVFPPLGLLQRWESRFDWIKR